MSTEHMVIVWSAAITALIVFILFAITDKNKFVNNLKDQARKDLYDVVVKQVFSEKEKLQEQMRISIAEKKLLEEQLKEKTSALSSIELWHSRVKHLERKNEALEKENKMLTYKLRKLKSYFMMSDISLCDLIESSLMCSR